MVLKKNFKLYLFEMPNFLTLSLNSFVLFSLSSILIEVSKSIKVRVEDLNLIFTFIIAGVIIGELTSTYYNYKIKKLNILIYGHSLLILLIILLTIAKNIYLFYLLYLLIGYFIGVLWIQAMENLLISEVKNKNRLTAIGLSFYSIGAVISPFVSSIIVKNNLNWRFVYLPSSLLIILTIILHLTIGKNRSNNNKKEVGQRYPLKEIFIDKKCNNFFLLTVIIYFTFMIAQTIISTWGPTFYRAERYFDIYSASLIISIYYITNFIGRVVIIYIIGKIKLNFLLPIISSMAFISFIFMVFSKNRGIVFTSLVIGGLACSGIVPILISTGTIIYDKGKGILVTILFALSGIGELISPLLIKLSIRHSAIGPMLLVIIFMAVTLFLVITRTVYNRKVFSCKADF